MSDKLKISLKYGIVLIITGVLFWLLLKDIPVEEFKSALRDFNYNWIFLSIGLSLISHFLRAWRWKLLLNSSDYSIKLSNSYFAVMIGYLINSVIPRLGELSRCGVAYKTEKVPVPFALGTVITERFIDLFMLLGITAVTFALQLNLLSEYITNASDQISHFFNNYWFLVLIAIVMSLTGLFMLFYLGRKSKTGLVSKVLDFVKQGIQGVLSIGKVKNQKGFWLSTIGIWILYFFMLYVITFGSDLTNELGVLAGLSILVMGSFGMASPTPNGLVTFHAFVAGVLVLYGIPKQEGIIFATILHTSQLITVLIFGSISLILVNARQKKKNIETQQA